MRVLTCMHACMHVGSLPHACMSALPDLVASILKMNVKKKKKSQSQMKSIC